MRKGIVFCVTAVLLVCSLCLNWLLCCENGKGRIEGRIKTDTTRVTVVDTVPYVKPVARDSLEVGYKRAKLPIADGRPYNASVRLSKPGDTILAKNYAQKLAENIPDSVRVDIPIVQKRYSDSTYTAWVSGYDVRLDSIRVYTRREVVTISRTIKGGGKGGYKRLGVNIGLGVGITPKGVQPYVGVGIGYRLF